MSTSFLKRQKEQQRKQKRLDKAARREERKQHKAEDKARIEAGLPPLWQHEDDENDDFPELRVPGEGDGESEGEEAGEGAGETGKSEAPAAGEVVKTPSAGEG